MEQHLEQENGESVSISQGVRRSRRLQTRNGGSALQVADTVSGSVCETEHGKQMDVGRPPLSQGVRRSRRLRILTAETAVLQTTRSADTVGEGVGCTPLTESEKECAIKQHDASSNADADETEETEDDADHVEHSENRSEQEHGMEQHDASSNADADETEEAEDDADHVEHSENRSEQEHGMEQHGASSNADADETEETEDETVCSMDQDGSSSDMEGSGTAEEDRSSLKESGATVCSPDQDGSSSDMEDSETAEEDRSSLKESDNLYVESDAEPVVLASTIPEVLGSARGLLDIEMRLSENGKDRSGAELGCANSPQDLLPSTKRAVLQVSERIKNNPNVYINCERWNKPRRGHHRLWDNIVLFAAKLPSHGRASNIFEAMRRYPSSILVYDGVHVLFGKSRRIGSTKIDALRGSLKAFSEFGPFGVSRYARGKWYEPDAHGRMQEAIVHVIAVTEYVMRVAYRACDSNGVHKGSSGTFLDQLRSDIVIRNVAGNTVFELKSLAKSEEISAGKMQDCLQRSVVIANKSIQDGAGIAGRKYGKKRKAGEERQKIPLWALKNMIPEIRELTP